MALHLILWGVFFWRDTQWTLMSPALACLPSFGILHCLCGRCLLFFFFVFGLAGTWLFTVVLVGARATLPFSRGACKLFLLNL